MYDQSQKHVTNKVIIQFIHLKDPRIKIKDQDKKSKDQNLRSLDQDLRSIDQDLRSKVQDQDFEMQNVYVFDLVVFCIFHHATPSITSQQTVRLAFPMSHL